MGVLMKTDLTSKDKQLLSEAQKRNALLFECFSQDVENSLNKVVAFYYNESISIIPTYEDIVGFCKENINPDKHEIMWFFNRLLKKRKALNDLKIRKKTKTFHIKGCG